MQIMRVTLQGCDDSTTVEMPVTGEQALFLIDLGRRIAQASECNCEPVMMLEVVE